MMSKQSLVRCCALVVLVGIVNLSRLAAQEIRSTASASEGDEAAQRIHQVLDQPLKTPLRYAGEQLNTVLEAIASEYGIPIIFDSAALDEVAISSESEIASINLFNISLRSALNLMLKEPGLEDLCYVIDEEVLLITTEEKANETLSVQVYRVDDLLDSGMTEFNAIEPASENHDRLIDLLTATVEYDSWKKHGTGCAEIRYYPPGMIIISQTRRVHDQIGRLLRMLRETKRQILANRKSSSSTTRPTTQGFAINVELGEDSANTRRRLADAIKKSVPWSPAAEKLAGHEAWIDVLPNRVLVHHLPTMLNQVNTVLTAMEILDKQYYESQQGSQGRN